MTDSLVTRLGNENLHNAKEKRALYPMGEREIADAIAECSSGPGLADG